MKEIEKCTRKKLKLYKINKILKKTKQDLVFEGVVYCLFNKRIGGKEEKFLCKFGKEIKNFGGGFLPGEGEFPS